MKKLRILFLAVLAMALMASGAFATAGDVTSIALTYGTENTTITLTEKGTDAEEDDPDYTGELTLTVGNDVDVTATVTFDISYPETTHTCTATVASDGSSVLSSTEETAFAQKESEATGTAVFTFTPSAAGTTTVNIVATGDNSSTKTATLTVTVLDTDATISSVAVTSGEQTVGGTDGDITTVNVSKDESVTLDVTVTLATDADITDVATVVISADADTADIVTLEVTNPDAADESTGTTDETWSGTLKITGLKSGDTKVTVKAGLADTEGNFLGVFATSTVEFTVHVVSAEVEEEVVVEDAVSPDVTGIAFSPASASVTAGATKTVTATVTLSNDAEADFTADDVVVTVTSKATATATAVKSSDITVIDATSLSFDIVVTGVAEGTTYVDVTVKVGEGTEKTVSFDVTVAAAGGEEEGTVTSPDIDWYYAYPFNSKVWTLYLSADKAGVTQTAAVVVSADLGTPELVISPDKNTYVKFEIADAVKSTSSDTRGTVYTFEVTATPLSADTTGSSFKAYATVASGDDDYLTSTLTFTVIVSDDTTTSGDSGGDSGTVVTSWDLTVTADKTEATLTYYEKTTVVITSRPADDGIDFTITNNASSTSTAYKLESSDEFTSTAYVVTYTFTAGETEGEYPITFTVNAASGDDTQTETVTVTFTVEYDSSKAAETKPEEPVDLADELGAVDGTPAQRTVGGHTFLIHSENDRKSMFAEGKGVVGWGLRAPFKVRKVFGPLGWWLRFLNAVAQAYFDLNSPTVYGAGIASIAADDTASRDAALSVGFEDDYTAFFELDLEKAAATLPEGATYQANSSYTPAATADDGGAASDPMTAGELKGTKSSTTPGGDTPGGDTPGGDEPGGDTEDLVDKVLGGSSGGCDAGFGALALALAASMIFVRKRS